MTRLDGLLPQVRVKAEELVKRCEDAGLDLFITQGLRTAAEQNILFSHGRTTPGPIVTHARAGQSWHNYGRAFDVCFKDKFGRLTWDGDWQKVGEIGKEIGLEWGGDFPADRIDRPHFQLREGLSLGDMAKVQI